MPTNNNKTGKTSNILSDTNTNAMQERLLVPTFTNKKDTQELDLHSMTEEDLMLLQKKDPFLYYSIPGVREAALSLKELDYSEALQSARKEASFLRKTRVSFENHTNNLLLDELFGDELDELDESDHPFLGELDDLLTKLLLFETQ